MSHRYNFTKGSAAFLIAVIVGGCAPRHFADGVAWEIRRSNTTNAAWQFVRDRHSLRLDSQLLDQLRHIESLHDVEDARGALRELIETAFDGARYAFDNEIDRLPDSSLEFLDRQYAAAGPTSNDLRESIRRRFWLQAELQHQRLQASVVAATALEEVCALAHNLANAAMTSPKDRHGRGPLLALVTASIKEDRGPLDHGGPEVDVYRPESDAYVDFAVSSSPAETALLRQYAPIIVQERIANATYPPDTDLIGTVRLRGTEDRYKIEIETSAPSVYGYVKHTWINGQAHVQLTYTHWFPRHPALKSLDTEAGEIEGATLRITLDHANRPAIFETVSNCGCYHRCYVATSVESAACGEFGKPVDGKSLCTERAIEGKMDWIVPETVDLPDAPQRPLLFSRAGYHGLAGLSFDRSDLLGEHRYALRPYETLERLPIRSAFRSMFGGDGLVHNAGRLEGFLLAPTGMLSAGQPRQRGTQLLHWDQYDFDDPHLLEHCLRLPSGL